MTKPRAPMRCAVIGAGFGGLAAAYDLARAGVDVTLLDASASVGGLASGFKEPHWDWSLERFYHHWFASDDAVLSLIAELGWTSSVVFRRPSTVVLSNGKWYPFDSIPTALAFPGLGFGVTKLRFGMVGLFLRLTNDWRTLEQSTADEWMRRHAGRVAHETIWKPLLIAKCGAYYDRVNMAWLWARLKARTTRLGTFEGGFQRFADMLAQEIRRAGGTIRLRSAVEGITPEATGLAVEAGTRSVFDQVLVTTSPKLLASMCPALPAAYLRGVLEMKSMGAVMMVLALRHQLSRAGHYWFNLPKHAGYPMLALVEHTNFVSPQHFGGDRIVYAGDYVEPGHEYMTLTDPQLLERFSPAFKNINSEFDVSWIRKMWVFKTDYAQPIPFVGHSRNIPAIPTPIDGLYFASMSQVYPWDRGTNFAVEIGRRAARMMLSRMPA